MARLTMCLMVALLAMATSVQKANKEYGGQTELELVKLENDWTNAMVAKDRDGVGRFMSDDFLMLRQMSSGELTDKKAFIDNGINNLQLISFSYGHPTLQIHGNTAVVHALFTFESMYSDKPWTGTSLITDTWVKEGGRWLIIARHSSKPPVVSQ